MNAQEIAHIHILGVQDFAKGRNNIYENQTVYNFLLQAESLEAEEALGKAWHRGYNLAEKYGVVWALGHAHGATDRDGNNKNIFYKQESHGVKVGQVDEGQWSGWQDSHLTYVPESAVAL